MDLNLKDLKMGESLIVRANRYAPALKAKPKGYMLINKPLKLSDSDGRVIDVTFYGLLGDDLIVVKKRRN